MDVRRVLLQTAAWAACGVLAAGAADAAVQARAQAQGPGLVVSGSLDGLAPGGTSYLHLRVDNPGEAAAGLRRLAVEVVGSGPGCPVSALTAQPWTGEDVVPAGGTVVRDLPLTLAADAPQACAGATWRLAYRAS